MGGRYVRAVIYREQHFFLIVDCCRRENLFAVAAKSAAVGALSGAALGGVSAGIVPGNAPQKVADNLLDYVEE